ncbi:zinc finger CCCH domain-containing protein 14 [Drosophila ficusphila]|uniref:zinc finger CCCH domain-containing protein 14 n=1 Tax=Drosophila ficusphila TaxID=30025 RepID=UPI0007E89B57|nr:zinc finger CCCH domain-containing protein 14 [Drosophila ficusphila]
MECNLGSEIGQKMRSAVKAKLLELGTGGSAGFIDDELPDYVMVMVANKRTKQQMNAELNLFLGDQTDLFVTWLHEVLQKLQEVTLPTSSASSKRRKSRGQGEAVKPKEKDKKGSKKDKRQQRKSGDELSEPQSSSADAMPVITSITAVFAEELLEKAKKTMDIDLNAKNEILHKKKNRKSIEDEEASVAKDLNLPGEISSTTSGTNRQKDLAELAEIQKKIHAAKKHLRQIGEIGDDSDEDDEDLLNLSAQEESVDQEPEEEPPQAEAPPRKAKSPIIFNRRERTPEKRPEDEPQVDSRREAVAAEEEEQHHHEPEHAAEKPKEDRSERRSVHDRLGLKAQQPPERSQRNQKELYVPAHRRRNEPEGGKERSQRERSRERRSSRDTSRDTNRNHRQRRSPSPEAPSSKQRIGSRVIVAVNKPPEPSDDEDLADKPVNSVIKIKPRPQVSPRRQACKNLLLRAVADAQRSTILAKTSSKKETEEVAKISSSSLGKRKSQDKSEGVRDRDRERERGKRSAPGNELFRRTTRELVVNVTQRDGKRSRRSNESRAEIKVVEEEYTPSLMTEELEPYVPQLLTNVDELDLHISSHDEPSPSSGAPKTQFVVTLNGDKALGGNNGKGVSYRKRPSNSRRRSSSPVSTPQVSSSSAEPTSTTADKRRRSNRDRSFSPSPTQNSRSPSLQTSRSLNRNEVLRQPQEIKKIIIKPDTDEDDEMHGLQKKRSPSKRQPVAAAATNSANGLKDNKAKAPIEDRSTTPPLPAKSKPRAERRASSKDKTTRSTSEGESAPAPSGAGAPSSTATKAKHTPIRFTLKNEDESSSNKKRHSGSPERDAVAPEKRRVPIRSAEDRKYDNLPALSAVSVDSTVLKVNKPKERCKYHPNCTKQFCEYYHPTAPCKSFPNCKFADKCMYSHPKCKFDMACMSVDCNYAHSGQRDLSHVQLAAPPLSSHVIPVQNYKSISAPVTSTTATTMCKYYPNCSKLGCTFYHPKPCRFGKNCVNKLECIFYHPEMQSKFKWVASLG